MVSFNFVVWLVFGLVKAASLALRCLPDAVLFGQAPQRQRTCTPTPVPPAAEP